MRWFFIFLIACLTIFLLRWIGRAIATPKQERIHDRYKTAYDLPLWVEVFNTSQQTLVAGRRLARLPAGEFGQGSCLLEGALDLKHVDPALRVAIERSCHPVYLEEDLVLAHIVARPSSDGDVMVGPLDDRELQNRIETAIAATKDEIDVWLEVTSHSVGLMEAEEERRAYAEVWQAYAPAKSPNSIPRLNA